MNTPIETATILTLLPHRYPFLLVDRVLSYEVMKSLIGIKNVSFNEPFFLGHYPGNPIMPGVLIVEAMAQACGILSYLSLEPKEGYKIFPLFAGIDNVRFKRVVEPGDQLKLHVEVLKVRRDLWKFLGVASVGEEMACTAEIMTIKGSEA